MVQIVTMSVLKGYPYYLRFTDNFEFLKYIEPTPGQRTIYKVAGDRTRQPFFAIGYPTAFLAFCHQVFGGTKYLEAAEELIDYALRINQDVRVNQWSHKLMWGTALVATITNKRKHWELVYDVANSIMLTVQFEYFNTCFIRATNDSDAHQSFRCTSIFTMPASDRAARCGGRCRRCM